MKESRGGGQGKEGHMGKGGRGGTSTREAAGRSLAALTRCRQPGLGQREEDGTSAPSCTHCVPKQNLEHPGKPCEGEKQTHTQQEVMKKVHGDDGGLSSPDPSASEGAVPVRGLQTDAGWGQGLAGGAGSF